MITGKILTISIHLSPSSLSNPSTPDKTSCSSTEKISEEQCPILFPEQDIRLPVLLTPRCGFGTVVYNGMIYIIGKIS